MFRFVQSKEALRRLALSLLGGLLLAIAVFFYEGFYIVRTRFPFFISLATPVPFPVFYSSARECSPLF